MNNINNKSWLITGGTGTLSLSLSKHIINNYSPKTIRMLSRSEYRQHLAKEKFDHEKLNWIIGDIANADRVMMATRHIDIIINCAAMKRVEIGERNPKECVRTNVYGVDNIINAAMTHGTSRVFHISTDKSVYPITIYGKAKALSEDLILHANVYSKSKTPMFSVGRFGNFIGSNGSVEELFAKQKAEGNALTVTHPDMKRFYIHPDKAAEYICKWINIMDGGEIFIPHMEQKHIMTIAKSISKDIEIIGLRGYEKLEEELFTEQEKKKLSVHKDYWIIK